MKFLAIFLITLIASSSAISLFQKYPINFGKSRNIAAVLSQIKATIASGGPLNKVLEFLADAEKQVRDEQASQDALQAAENARCEKEIAFRKQEIQDAESAIDQGTKDLNSCTALLNTARTNLANNLVDQSNKREMLGELITARQVANAKYLERVKDINDALAAINEAESLLHEVFEGEASLLQLSTVAKSMLKHTVKVRATKLYAPIASILAQVASKKVLADSSTLEKIRNLLKKLTDHLNNELQLQNQHEADEKAKYEKEKSDLEGNIASLEADEKTFREEIATNENCVAQKTQYIQAATAKKGRNSELLDQETEMCANFNQGYKDGTEKRNSEIQLIQEVTKIVEARYGQINDYVKDRGDNEWAKYQNPTEYKAADQYKHEGGNYNEGGAKQAGYQRTENLENLF